ncbi:MAG: helix-turn-helix domain-containing protein [Prevotella sp.]|nr:helix-turn-helix domain-containing protein [Prevotella sp.]
MVNFYEYSTPELVRLLGERFKEYRMRCNLTQKEVAEQSGIGLTTIHKFENGTAGNLSLSTFILLLKVIGQVDALDDVMPELPESPYLIRKEEKKAQRIRHTKK